MLRTDARYELALRRARSKGLSGAQLQNVKRFADVYGIQQTAINLQKLTPKCALNMKSPGYNINRGPACEELRFIERQTPREIVQESKRRAAYRSTQRSIAETRNVLQNQREAKENEFVKRLLSGEFSKNDAVTLAENAASSLIKQQTDAFQANPLKYSYQVLRIGARYGLVGAGLLTFYGRLKSMYPNLPSLPYGAEAWPETAFESMKSFMNYQADLKGSDSKAEKPNEDKPNEDQPKEESKPQPNEETPTETPSQEETPNQPVTDGTRRRRVWSDSKLGNAIASAADSFEKENPKAYSKQLEKQVTIFSGSESVGQLTKEVANAASQALLYHSRRPVGSYAASMGTAVALFGDAARNAVGLLLEPTVEGLTNGVANVWMARHTDGNPPRSQIREEIEFIIQSNQTKQLESKDAELRNQPPLMIEYVPPAPAMQPTSNVDEVFAQQGP